MCRADATGMDAMEHLSIGMEFHTWELFFIITAVHMVHYNYRVEGTGGGGLLTKLHTSKTKAAPTLYVCVCVRVCVRFSTFQTPIIHK